MLASVSHQLEVPRIPNRQQNLIITQRRFCDVAILDCSGRLVVGHHTEQLFEAVRNAMDTSPWILLNLSGVNAVDSGGLGSLVLLHRFADAGMCDLKICSVNRKVSDLLHLTKLHTVLDLHANEDHAIESFYRAVA